MSMLTLSVLMIGMVVAVALIGALIVAIRMLSESDLHSARPATVPSRDHVAELETGHQRPMIATRNDRG